MDDDKMEADETEDEQGGSERMQSGGRRTRTMTQILLLVTHGELLLPGWRLQQDWSTGGGDTGHKYELNLPLSTISFYFAIVIFPLTHRNKWGPERPVRKMKQPSREIRSLRIWPTHINTHTHTHTYTYIHTFEHAITEPVQQTQEPGMHLNRDICVCVCVCECECVYPWPSCSGGIRLLQPWQTFFMNTPVQSLHLSMFSCVGVHVCICVSKQFTADVSEWKPLSYIDKF